MIRISTRVYFNGTKPAKCEHVPTQSSNAHTEERLAVTLNTQRTETVTSEGNAAACGALLIFLFTQFTQ